MITEEAFNRLIEEFRAQMPEVQGDGDPDALKDQCIRVSHSFVQFLRQRGGSVYNVRYVELLGIPSYCLDAPEEMQHVIVYAFGKFIDWTLCQFITDARVPTIYDSIQPLLDEWCEVRFTTQLDWDMPGARPSDEKSPAEVDASAGEVET
jgi:hypothetical protein